jgi:predicted metalloenzyme YecM
MARTAQQASYRDQWHVLHNKQAIVISDHIINGTKLYRLNVNATAERTDQNILRQSPIATQQAFNAKS